MAPYEQFDRGRLRFRSLRERRNLLRIEDEAADPARPPRAGVQTMEQIRRVAAWVQRSRAAGRPVVLAYGAHAIKNGLAAVMIQLAERGWVTHFATNGAGVIHDWEFAFQGESSEDVRANVAAGTFGIWEETGRCINLAVLVGAWRGLGLGQSVGAMIHEDGLLVPTAEALRGRISEAVGRGEADALVPAAADLWQQIAECRLAPGRVSIPHLWKPYSVTAAAYRLGVPLTVHPGVGYDIIYTHPLNHGGAIGRTALRDFLTFAHSIGQLTGGVYLSVGSAIMSPMVFEKAMSMAQNVALQAGGGIHDHCIAVNDVQEGDWDWSKGEPPTDDPAYYLRFCKSFSRMGGELEYVCADNRVFLGNLLAELRQQG